MQIKSAAVTNQVPQQINMCYPPRTVDCSALIVFPRGCVFTAAEGMESFELINISARRALKQIKRADVK